MTALYIIAIGIIVAGALVPRLRASDHPVARSLVRSFGVRPSGLGGEWTLGDHWRAARGYTIAVVALFGIALSAPR